MLCQWRIAPLLHTAAESYKLTGRKQRYISRSLMMHAPNTHSDTSRSDSNTVRYEQCNDVAKCNQWQVSVHNLSFSTRKSTMNTDKISTNPTHSITTAEPTSSPSSSSSSTNFITRQVLKQNFGAAMCHVLHYSCNVNAAAADSLHCRMICGTDQGNFSKKCLLSSLVNLSQCTYTTVIIVAVNTNIF